MLSKLTTHMESMLTMKDQVETIAQDLLRLRVAVMPELPPEEAQCVYSPRVHTDILDFVNFCKNMAEEPEFALLVVSNRLACF